MNVQSLIESGHLTTTVYDAAPAVGRYQGNGRFGAVFSRLGLHAHPANKDASDVHGHTQFTHLRHWGRFHFFSGGMQADTTADYLLPLARIHWETEPVNIRSYRQTQSFHDGTLDTTFGCEGAECVNVSSWFDPVQRNLAVLRFAVRGRVSPVILGTDTGFNPYRYAYPDLVQQEVAITREGAAWVMTITCGAATPPVVSRLYVQSDARIEPCAGGLRLFPVEGESTVLLSYGEPAGADDAAETSHARTLDHWHRTWQESAWFDFPDLRQQQTWVRSLAYILSSFNEDGIGFTPTNGLTGNPFPFNFAQDLFYVLPVLLASGHVNVARAWIERFRQLIPGMQAYAKHLWPGVEGIYPPWELPYGPIEGYHQPSVPIFYCYEPHNAAYLARMAHDTGVMLDNPDWMRQNVWPLIAGTARFFRSFCHREEDGRWHFDLTPSIGQDEAGGRNQKDYLDTLFGAKYVFQRAVEHGLDADDLYAQILSDGLAFDSLLSDQGFFYASAGSGPTDFGRQKHPVQLNGLAYLPVEPAPLAPERTAHALRYATTSRATEPFFYGWTLGEFLLASARLGDVAGWRKDWDNVRASNYTDPEWVQIYETSGTTFQSFYVTTHGLVAQSLADTVVSDYWGELALGACRVHDAPVRFGNVRSRLGVTVGGEVAPSGEGWATLVAWKDCAFVANGQPVILERGERREVVLGSRPLSRPF